MEGGEQNIGGYGQTAAKELHSKFNWFTQKIFQNEIMRSNRGWVKAIADNPYHFFVHKNSNDWIALNRCKLWGEMSIMVDPGNGGNLEAPTENDIYSIVNNPFHALWSSVVIKVNGSELENSSQTDHHWKSYIENKFNISKSFKKNVMNHNSAWIDDDIGKGDKCGANVMKETIPNTNWTQTLWEGEGPIPSRMTPNPDYNSGFVKRRKNFTRGTVVPFSIPIIHDFMTSGKSFPPNTELEFIFTRTPDSFVLIQDKNVCAKNLRIVLKNLRLSYDYEVVTPRVQNAHISKSLKSKPTALVKKNIIKWYTKSEGESDMSKDGLFYTSKNNLPEQIIIFIMPLAQFNGTLATNPYYWTSPYKFSEIGLVVNGWYEPSRFLKTTTEAGKLELYHHVLDNIGFGDQKITSDIPLSYEEFFGGSFMIPFDRTAAKHNGFYTTLPDSGTMDIHLKLENDKYLEDTYVVCVYASYTEEIVIDDGNYSFHPLEVNEV